MKLSDFFTSFANSKDRQDSRAESFLIAFHSWQIVLSASSPNFLWQPAGNRIEAFFGSTPQFFQPELTHTVATIHALSRSHWNSGNIIGGSSEYIILSSPVTACSKPFWHRSMHRQVDPNSELSKLPTTLYARRILKFNIPHQPHMVQHHHRRLPEAQSSRTASYRLNVRWSVMTSVFQLCRVTSHLLALLYLHTCPRRKLHFGHLRQCLQIVPRLHTQHATWFHDQ